MRWRPILPGIMACKQTICEDTVMPTIISLYPDNTTLWVPYMWHAKTSFLRFHYRCPETVTILSLGEISQVYNNALLVHASVHYRFSNWRQNLPISGNKWEFYRQGTQGNVHLFPELSQGALVGSEWHATQTYVLAGVSWKCLRRQKYLHKLLLIPLFWNTQN